MCLGIPGEVTEIFAPDANGVVMGKVNFAGIIKNVCLSYVPEAKVGDFVIVHVGFAISRLDADEARSVFELLGQMGELQEIRAGDGDTEAAGA
jgi:hydrogenase expression/formation protein HypC